MKSTEIKQEFVKLRAEGESFSVIAGKLQISKSTCTKWGKELEADIAKIKQEELNSLYDAYSMRKTDRIKKLGGVLERIDDALSGVDLTEVSPEKLLDYKLKYTEALKGEYISTEPAFELSTQIKPIDIVNALADLLNRIRAGEVSTEQAQRESLVLGNLLKAYETVEIKAKLDEIEAIVGGYR